MPYARIEELPKAVRDAYPPVCLNVFRKAFNAAAADSSNDEASAFRIAHAAAKKCAGK